MCNGVYNNNGQRNATTTSCRTSKIFHFDSIDFLAVFLIVIYFIQHAHLLAIFSHITDCTFFVSCSQIKIKDSLGPQLSRRCVSDTDMKSDSREIPWKAESRFRLLENDNKHGVCSAITLKVSADGLEPVLLLFHDRKN